MVQCTEGNLHMVKKHGYGVYEWRDGSKYIGQWRANAINGHGHWIGRDEREIRGTWQNAVIHGCGKYSWPEGCTFCGQYIDDQKQGFGIFKWKDGRRFEGFWHKGQAHGYGITYKANGEVQKKCMWDMGAPMSSNSNGNSNSNTLGHSNS